MSNRFLEKLTSYIKDFRLTDCIELLEQWGYTNESALQLLSYLQVEGVGA